MGKKDSLDIVTEQASLDVMYQSQNYTVLYKILRSASQHPWDEGWDNCTVLYELKEMQVLPSANRRFPEITGKDNLSVFLLRESEVPWMEAAAEKSLSTTVLDLQAWTYYKLY